MKLYDYTRINPTAIKLFCDIGYQAVVVNTPLDLVFGFLNKMVYLDVKSDCKLKL